MPVKLLVRFPPWLLLVAGVALMPSRSVHLLEPSAAALAPQAPSSSAPVTFSKDIQPILLANCASCHRPEGSAAFSLLTYADAKQHGAAIVAATKSRYMPPWKPDPGIGDFVGVRRLSNEQIATVERWVIA